MQETNIATESLNLKTLNYLLDGKLLSDDVTHYVVPDCKVVQEYLEILEFPELKGIIFMQTACQAVQHQKGRRYLSHKNLFFLFRLK